MLQRVMPGLMGMKNILVMNDEAHHCYREKPDDGDNEDLKGDDRKEAEKARLENEAVGEASPILRLPVAGSAIYRRKVEALEAALRDETIRPEAIVE